MKDKNGIQLRPNDRVFVNASGGGSGARYAPSVCAEGEVRCVDHNSCMVDFKGYPPSDHATVCYPDYIERING